MLNDFEKLHCPFVRKIFPISQEDFKQYRYEYNIRTPELYLAINEVNSGYEWVFEDKETIAVEKLDGSNFCIRTENSYVVEVQNRDNIIETSLKLNKVNGFYLGAMEGILSAIKKGYLKDNYIQYGELLGPEIQGNPYKLDKHILYPFEKTIGSLRYKSFNNYEPTYENLSNWFKTHLKSLFYSRVHNIPIKDCDIFSEGVIFYNFKRKEQGLVYRAKLRRDMFPNYYDKIIIPGI